MKFFILLLIFVTSAHADEASDFIWRIFTDTRVATNHHLAQIMGNTCSRMVAEVHLRECRDQHPRNMSVETLESQLKKIDLSVKEAQFIERAHAEQREAMSCEIMQLRGLLNEESVKPFYGRVMEDLCHKLPELKRRWDKMTQYQKEYERAESTFKYNNNPTNFRFADTSHNTELINTINSRAALMKKENHVYLQLKSSIWHSDDPIMDSYIYDAMMSPAKTKDVCLGGSSNDNYATYFPQRHAFEENIIRPMISKAQDNLFKIGEKPTDAGVAGVRLLLEKSDWAKSVNELGTIDNSLMMCDLDQKYASGDDRSQKFMTVGSFALGGAGAFLKVAKFASFLRPATIQRMLSASRVLMTASAFPYAPLSIEHMADSCIGPTTAYSLKGAMCPLNEFGLIDMKRMIETENHKMDSENCAVSLTLAGTTFIPETAQFLKSFRGTRATASFVPITMQKVVNSAELRATEKKMLARLDELHIKTTPVAREEEVGGMGSTYVERNVRLWKKQTLEGEKYYGTLLKVTDLPPPALEGTAATNAFRHPRMAGYKKRLEDMGYTLAIDTSLPSTGAEAYNWGYRKVVAMRPDSNWQTFVHEFQHVEFDKYLAKRFHKLETAVSRGTSLKDVLKLKIQSRLGLDRMTKLESLLKKEVPELAINEALSVDEELKALGFRRYVPGVGSRSEKYALRYRITEIERIRNPSEIQRQTLKESKVRYLELERYEGLPVAATAVGATIASGAITHAVMFPEDYRQIVYNDQGEVIAQKPDGTWSALTEKILPR